MWLYLQQRQEILSNKEAKDGKASVRDVATSLSSQVGAYECAEITWHVYNIQYGVWGAGMHVDGM